MQKSDLDQIGKLVRKIVREEVETEIGNSKDSLEHEITTSNLHVRGEIQELSGRMKNVEIRVNEVGKKVDKLDRKVDAVHKSLKKEIKYTAHILDKDNMETKRRVRKIEEHLNLPQN